MRRHLLLRGYQSSAAGTAAAGPPTKYFCKPDYAAAGLVAVLAHHRFVRDLYDSRFKPQ
jgi:hypothetical protein